MNNRIVSGGGRARACTLLSDPSRQNDLHTRGIRTDEQEYFSCSRNRSGKEEEEEKITDHRQTQTKKSDRSTRRRHVFHGDGTNDTRRNEVHRRYPSRERRGKLSDQIDHHAHICKQQRHTQRNPWVKWPIINDHDRWQSSPTEANGQQHHTAPFSRITTITAARKSTNPEKGRALIVQQRSERIQAKNKTERKMKSERGTYIFVVVPIVLLKRWRRKENGIGCIVLLGIGRGLSIIGRWLRSHTRRNPRTSRIIHRWCFRWSDTAGRLKPFLFIVRTRQSTAKELFEWLVSIWLHYL